MSPKLEGGCACGEVRYRLCVRAALRSLLPPPELPAADRERLRDQRADRGRSCRGRRGEPVPVDVPRGGGKTQRIFRCPTCQVAVFSRYTSARVLFVRGGTLDEPSSIEPDVHIYTRSKLPWVVLPEGIPAFRTYYDTEKLWPAASLERLRALRRSRATGE